jgi:hypothetical protein
MHGIRHPFSQALYEPEEGGRVRITQPDGRTGFFSKEGKYLEGDKLDADPQLCGWVCSPRGVHRMVNTASH